MGNLVAKVTGQLGTQEHYEKNSIDVQKQDYDKQEGCGLAWLPIEVLMAIVEYSMYLQDFVHLITTCKYLNYEFIGPSSILWAHICQTIGDINFIVRSIQFARRWKLDLRTVEPTTIIIDINDRQAIAALNFRDIIDEYYMRMFHKASLRDYIQNFMISVFNQKQLSYARIVTIEIKEYSINNISNLFCPAAATNKRFRKDYIFVVDLELDPAEIDASNEIPCTKGGRMVVYKKSRLYSNK